MISENTSDNSQEKALNKTDVISRSDITNFIIKISKDNLIKQGIPVENDEKCVNILQEIASMFGFSFEQQIDAAETIIKNGSSLEDLRTLFDSQFQQGKEKAKDYDSIEDFADRTLSDGFPKNGL